MPAFVGVGFLWFCSFLFTVVLKYMYYALGIVVLAILAYFISSVRSTMPAEANITPSNVTNITVLGVPDCVSSLDCGVSGPTDYFCWDGFIAKDYVTYTCLDKGFRNATCLGTIKREVIDWCRPEEYCMPGKSVCQPNITSCHDGIRDQGETGVDCGGSCPPCVSCYNGILDGDETSIDCGGICHSCTIQCTSNVSCGLPHWGPTYCWENGSIYQDERSVYQDYFTYECKVPGNRSSYCKKYRLTRISDYCGPFNKCVNGNCRNMTYGALEMPDYVCSEGELCADDNEIYTTCRGAWCFKVKNNPV